MSSRLGRPETLTRGRLAITEAAIKLFDARGYHGSSVSDIAEAAGMTVGGLYKYIGSKEDILLLLSEQLQNAMEVALTAPLAPNREPVGALIEAIEHYAQLVHEPRKAIRVLYREFRELDKRGRDTLNEQGDRSTELFSRLLRAAGRPELVSDDELLWTMARNVLYLLQMWAVQGGAYRMHMTHEQFIERQLALALRQIGVKESRLGEFLSSTEPHGASVR
jgi:TetR/AcrR family transcriptional regulator, cholesterol catabolism regulator